MCVCLSVNLHTSISDLENMTLERLGSVAEAYLKYTEKINEEMKKIGKK